MLSFFNGLGLKTLLLLGLDPLGVRPSSREIIGAVPYLGKRQRVVWSWSSTPNDMAILKCPLWKLRTLDLMAKPLLSKKAVHP